MKMRLRMVVVVLGLALLSAPVWGQSVLFDLENAPIHASLPIDLTVDGVTAHFSATGQGFSIQPADALSFTPSGFSGLCIYPNSVFAADLLVAFSHSMTNFSILYSPQELGCDDSARMKVTAYSNGVAVGTNNTTARFPGTWPSETLSLASAKGFNNVVIHYDARPPTCQDYGVIFLADNMTVTLAPPGILLTEVVLLAGGAFQFTFTNSPGRSFTVFSTTNLSVPSTNWTSLGAAMEVDPGRFQFTDTQTINHSNRFYRVRSP